MAPITKRWDFRDEDLHRYTVILELGSVTRARTITLNGREVVRGGGRLRSAGEHRFAFEGHSALVRVTSKGFGLNYELIVDGALVPAEGATIARAGSTADTTDTPPTADGAKATVTPSTALDVRRDALRRQVRSGGQWFYWIAALSAINYVLFMTGSTGTFAVGTSIDWFLHGILDDLRVPPAIAHIAVIAFFGLMGRRATSGTQWAFILGGLVYAVDSLLLFVIQIDWFAVALHGLAMFSVVGGWRALRELRSLEPAASAGAAP